MLPLNWLSRFKNIIYGIKVNISPLVSTFIDPRIPIDLIIKNLTAAFRGQQMDM